MVEIGVATSTIDANLEDHEGVLITVNVAQCTNDDVANNYGQWEVNDGSGAILVDDLLYAFAPTLNAFYDVTGPMMYSFSERKIEPRDMADVSLVSSIGENVVSAISIYPNPTRDRFQVELGANAARTTYTLSDMQGRTVQEGLLTSDRNTIDVESIENGRYLLLLISNEGFRTGIVQVLR